MYDLAWAGNDWVVVQGADGGPTDMANPATISGFRLDKYEVTVGRFRQFVAAWGNGWTPAAGTGKHSHLNGGMGLVGANGSPLYEPGWSTADNANVAPTDANLACNTQSATWTSLAGPNEALPINCVVWAEAYAFCIWDGGFLPSNAEAELAEAGGSEQRLYPWGSADPGAANQYAIYNCNSGNCSVAPVGTAFLGAGRWGQIDLAGNVGEWGIDYLSNYVDPCADCASLTPTSAHVARGGDYASTAETYLVPSDPLGYTTDMRSSSMGVRCARVP